METYTFSSNFSMKFWLKFCLLLSLSLPLHAVPTKRCKSPVVRKEWRTLSDAERQSYIAAIKCLTAKPALTSTVDIPGVRNRFDDFVGSHIIHTPTVHFVGVFKPWHRLFLHSFEEELHQCGFDGGQPYWDWTLDARSPEDFYGSPIFNPETGFGGNGDWVPGNYTHPADGVDLVSSQLLDIPDRTGGGCITDGPFKDMVTNLGPIERIAYNPRCIRRDFSASMFNLSSASSVKSVMAIPDFGNFTRVSEITIHGGVHIGVGGLYGNVRDTHASPSDPIFYLHHSNIDRVWWSWQSQNLAKRLKDISGPLVAEDFDNQAAGNATLDTIINVGTTVNITASVRDVMDIQGGILCYTYDELYETTAT